MERDEKGKSGGTVESRGPAGDEECPGGNGVSWSGFQPGKGYQRGWIHPL